MVFENLLFVVKPLLTMLFGNTWAQSIKESCWSWETFVNFVKLDLLKYGGRENTVVESALVDLWRQEKNKSPLTFLLLQQNWPKSPFIKYCCKWPPGDTCQNHNFHQIKGRLESTLPQYFLIYPLHFPQNTGFGKILVLNGRSLGDKSMDDQNYFPSFLWPHFQQFQQSIGV